MNVSVTSTSTLNPTNFAPARTAVDNGSVPVAPANSTRGLIFELGLWLSGIESFLYARNHSLGESSQNKAALRDWTKEFYLTNSTLSLCSKLALELCQSLKNNYGTEDNEAALLDGLTGVGNGNEFSFEEIFDLSVALKDSILINEALLRSAPLRFAEWTAWSNTLSEKFKNVSAVKKLIENAEREGEDFLPQTLKDLLQNKAVSMEADTDLRIILPQIAKILRWLAAIEKMHDNDEPLKPALLLFARINEQAQAMMSYVNNRLRRFAKEDDAFFVMLDCAVYAASIEVRKVYNFELVGVSEIRQTPLIYAKIETAHGLLNDCFQQIVVNFAQLLEPAIEPTHLFPSFRTKFEQSLALRSELWRTQQAVQKVEKNPKDNPLEELHKKLTDFQNGPMRALFYKDTETVERFIEEVMRTHSRNDIAPILHRFGAYLETLLGQVSMRTILANHPFDYPKE